MYVRSMEKKKLYVNWKSCNFSQTVAMLSFLTRVIYKPVTTGQCCIFSSSCITRFHVTTINETKIRNILVLI